MSKDHIAELINWKDCGFKYPVNIFYNSYTNKFIIRDEEQKGFIFTLKSLILAKKAIKKNAKNKVKFAWKRVGYVHYFKTGEVV